MRAQAIATEISEDDYLREVRHQHFWKTLEHFVRKASFSFPRNRQCLILDVACGDAEEAVVLNCFFGSGIYCIPTLEAKVYGVEQSEKKVRMARANLDRYCPASFAAPFNLVSNCELVQGDARELSQMGSLPEKVDFILVRHPHIREDRDKRDTNWQRIFSECLQKLDPNGLFMITSFIEMENELILSTLSGLPARVLINELNPHAIPLIHNDPIAGDKWVTLVKRIQR